MRPINYQEVTSKRPTQHSQRNEPSAQGEREGNIRNVFNRQRQKNTAHTTKEISNQIFQNGTSNIYKTTNDNRKANDRRNASQRYETPKNYQLTNTKPVLTQIPKTSIKEYQYSTENPYRKPGGRPAFVTNYPPLTNKPVTQRSFAVFPVPTDSSAIRFPAGDDESPKVLTGPDEDRMSSVEKRRYAEIAERSEYI